MVVSTVGKVVGFKCFKQTASFRRWYGHRSICFFGGCSFNYLVFDAASPCSQAPLGGVSPLKKTRRGQELQTWRGGNVFFFLGGGFWVGVSWALKTNARGYLRQHKNWYPKKRWKVLLHPKDFPRNNPKPPLEGRGRPRPRSLRSEVPAGRRDTHQRVPPAWQAPNALAVTQQVFFKAMGPVKKKW